MKFERFEEGIVKTVDELQHGDLFVHEPDTAQELVFVSAVKFKNADTIRVNAKLPIGEPPRLYPFMFHTKNNKFHIIGKVVDDETV